MIAGIESIPMHSTLLAEEAEILACLCPVQTDKDNKQYDENNETLFTWLELDNTDTDL